MTYGAPKIMEAKKTQGRYEKRNTFWKERNISKTNSETLFKEKQKPKKEVPTKNGCMVLSNFSVIQRSILLLILIPIIHTFLFTSTAIDFHRL